MAELINDGLSIHGSVALYLFEGDLPAEVVADAQRLAAFLETQTPVQIIDNLATNVMRQQVIKLSAGETASYIGYIGLSTSLTTASLALTALTNEIYRQPVSIRQSINSYYLRVVAYFATTTFGSTGIAGAGTFDTASTGGSMWNVASVSVSKTSSQSLTVDWRTQATT